MLIKNITELIGNTPIIEISPEIHGLSNIELYAKLELFNPFGSLKDRAALKMLESKLAYIKKNNLTVIESSSGNMAKSMRILCSMHSIPFQIVTNLIKIREVKSMLQFLGAKIDEFPGISNCPDPLDPNDPLRYIRQLVAGSSDAYYHPSQFTSQRNIAAHFETTGPEIFSDIGSVDFFFGGIGSGGSTIGTAFYLKSINPEMKLIGCVGTKGALLPGLRNSDELINAGIFHQNHYDEIIEINQDEAIDKLSILVNKLGILSGPSGGASYACALKYLQKIDQKLTRKHKAVFIVCDRLEPYTGYLERFRPDIFGKSNKNGVDFSKLSDNDYNSVPELNANELDQLIRKLDDQDKIMIVDLRSPLSFKAKHIKNSINIPSSALENLLEWGEPFSKSTSLVLVCNQGEESKKFAALLRQKGFAASNLQGGFSAWRSVGKELYSNIN